MDLDVPFSTLSVENFPSKVQNFASEIGGHHTEFVIIYFPNCIHLIITQFGKIGNLYQVKIDQPENGISITEPVFTITSLLGGDNIQAEVAVRFLTEKLKIRKPFLVSLCLKDFSKISLIKIIEAVQGCRRN